MSNAALQYKYPSRQWHYVLCDCCLGPIAEQDFLLLVQNGKIPLQTEVWYKGLKQWATLEQVLPQLGLKKAEPAKPALKLVTQPAPPEPAQPEPAPPSAWLRLLARSIDMAIFLPLMSWLLVCLPPSSRLSDISFILLAIGAAILLEALCLSQLAATPGKSLLGIRVKQKNGQNLTFTQALRRAGLAWIMGTGLFCSWAVSLAFLWASYKLLKQRGSTLWDMETGHQVQFASPGFSRKIVGTAASLGCMCLFFLV